MTAVLIVEDERIVALSIKLALQRLGYDVVGMCASGAAALALAAEHHPDVVLMDIHIEGDVDGIETAARIRRQHQTPVVFLTAHAEDAILSRARATQPYGYVIKPFTERDLHVALQVAVERRRSETALVRSEGRLRLALDAAALEAIELVADDPVPEPSGEQAAARPITLRSLLARVAPDDRGAVEATLSRALRTGEAFTCEFRGDGDSERWLHLQGRTLGPTAEPGRRLFGVLHDVTEHKRTEALRRQAVVEIERARVAAEEANRLKSDLIADVSHEIRTPMNVVLGLTEIVLDSALGEEQRLHLERVHAAARGLIHVVNDLLDSSRIEAGRLELVDAPFDVRIALAEAVGPLEDTARRKGLGLHWEVDPSVPARLVGDRGRWHQVVVNLVGNAIKFTDSGEVRIAVDRVPEDDVESRPTAAAKSLVLRVRVEDTGIGITPSNRQAIFERFRQADGSGARRAGGAGLGLSISARIAAAMGGSIRVDSEVGRGSRFDFIVRLGVT